MDTPYKLAWEKFRQSQTYKKISTDIPSVGKIGAERFLENRFREAFDAGWNAKTSSILKAIHASAGDGFPDGPQTLPLTGP